MTKNFFEDRRKRLAVLCALLLCVSFVYHGVGLHTFSHWWFEDDPSLFAYARSFGNPLKFFWNREVFSQFNGTMPMQPLSLWIDSAIAYRSILFAHLHLVISLTITLVLLFNVLRRFGLSEGEALVLDLLWLCLPGVVAVNEFLSSRHYLEGFAFSLSGILMAQKIAQGRWQENTGTISLLFGALTIGALYKELYAITVPLFAFLYLFSCGKHRAAIAALAIIPLYGSYRIWAIGMSFTWKMPLLGWREYLQFLGRLPYFFAENVGGYLMIGALAFLLLWRVRNLNLRVAGCVLLLIGSALASICPTSFALNSEWLVRGTWDRVMFLLSSMILLGGGYWLCKTQPASIRIGIVALAAITLAAGGYGTQRHWDREMKHYEAEGRYYLQHPDRLLYSEVPAPWYLDGIRQLYDIDARHHITFAERKGLSPEQVATYQTIWRYRNGAFVEDRHLYDTLAGK